MQTRAPSVAAMFSDRVENSADKEAFRIVSGDGWESITWSQVADRVNDLAAGLLALGLESQQRVGIASGTRFEWVLADLAVMAAGGASTTVYPSTHADDTAYILADSESRILFAEDDSQVQKVTSKRDELPNLETIVVFEGSGDGDGVITLDELAAKGAEYLKEHPSSVQDATEKVTSDQLATLIYTSGTTGRPKGVRLPHRSWVYYAEAIESEDFLGEDDVQLMWLPLAHSMGKAIMTFQLACGFVSAIDGRVDKIVENMGVVKPTFMAAVPRIFEKAYARVVTTQQSEGGVKAALFERAFAVGREVDRRRGEGKSVSPLLSLQHKLFDRLVFSKVRERFGGRMRFFVSGSAPLNRDIADWFHAAGLLILEGYGLTESAGGGFVNRPDNYKLGTVGPPLPGTEVRISEEGEVQLDGPLVMDGYHNLDEKTAETMTEDGWLRTGDRGSLDDDGFLTITGRIKELFKTSGGKYVAPPSIEAKFMALCPYASQFLVFGEGRNFCVALITLDPDATSGWAREQGVKTDSYEELVKTDEVRDMVDEHVSKLNKDLNKWETIKKWELLDHELSIDSGELTPSLKVKRTVVAENNKDVLDNFYS